MCIATCSDGVNGPRLNSNIIFNISFNGFLGLTPNEYNFYVNLEFITNNIVMIIY